MEILISVGVIAVAMVPVLYVASSNVEEVRVDRARLICNTLCLTVLERFGRHETSPWDLLTPTDNPQERAGSDLWKRDEQLRTALESPEIRAIVESHRVQSTVVMIRDVDPGLHRIISEVTWEIKTDAGVRRDRVTFSRFVVKPELR